MGFAQSPQLGATAKKLAFVEQQTVAPTPAPLPGAMLKAREQPLDVDLNDGSRLHLAPRSALTMQTVEPQETRLALSAGGVTCDVIKNENREFLVTAGPVSVRVVGTKFSVQRSQHSRGESISVTVERGVVEVTGPDGVQKRLAQGETWSVLVTRASAQNQGEQHTLPPHKPNRSPTDPRASPQEQKPHAKDSAPSPARTAHEPAESATRREPTAMAGATSPLVDAPVNSNSVEHEDFFARANAARRSGNPAEAARLYERFLTTTSNDARAGVAALELGRLKMDHLGDVKGAIPWLSRAAQLGAGGFGDDAWARLVLAHDDLGQLAACRKARAHYLSAHPRGVHLRRVKASCP